MAPCHLMAGDRAVNHSSRRENSDSLSYLGAYEGVRTVGQDEGIRY